MLEIQVTALWDVISGWERTCPKDCNQESFCHLFGFEFVLSMIFMEASEGDV